MKTTRQLFYLGRAVRRTVGALAGASLLAAPIGLSAAAAGTHQWRATTIADTTGRGSLNGVSCPTTTFCMAVWDYFQRPGFATSSATWNGSTWTLRTTAEPAGALGAKLNAVHCSWAQSCTAVGQFTNSSGVVRPLVEHWNGTSWIVIVTPAPPGAKAAALNGISCLSADFCQVVGYYVNATDSYPSLVESWNGHHWSIPSTPNPSGNFMTPLSSVACTATNACLAVGSLETSDGEFAELFNGSVWSLSKLPATGSFGAFNSVSCGAANSCVAVGGHSNTSGSLLGALAELWNGKSWSVLKAAAPTGATSSPLAGVSCRSAALCVAVGSFSATGHPTATLAETYKGGTTWMFTPTPNPTSSQSSYLLSVSCGGSTSCMAGSGYFASGIGDSLPSSQSWNGSSWTLHTVP